MSDSVLIWMLRQARSERQLADTNYLHAIALAKEHGWGNSRIARAMGCSETAVRMYWKRHSHELDSDTFPNHIGTSESEVS